MTPSTAIALIGIDWGSTHCRAFRFNGEGHVSATHHGDSDVGTLAGGDFPGALQRLVGDWLNADASAPLCRISLRDFSPDTVVGFGSVFSVAGSCGDYWNSR